MKKYTVIITETLKRDFDVEAESYHDAIQQVKDRYYNYTDNPDYVLSADDYYNTEFECVKAVE